MRLSQKTHYALRAVLELALRYGEGPVKVADIAAAQDIPPRFLEMILHQLKPVLVDSRRGVDGGYLLMRDPATLTVGEVLRAVQGPASTGSADEAGSGRPGRLNSEGVFAPLWRRAEEAVQSIYDGTTFRALAEQEAIRRQGSEGDYSI